MVALARGAGMAGRIALQAFTRSVRFTVTLAEAGARVSVGGLTPSRPTKFRWNHLRQKVGEGRTRALKIAGAEVRRASQREMSVRAPLKIPRFVEVGTSGGRRLVAKIREIPKPDRVTSWKTARHPKGFLRSDIQYDYDPASDTVVAGPVKAPRLNRLHEVGGSVNLWFLATSPPRNVPRKFSGGTVFGVLRNRPIGDESIELGQRPVKARRFMAKGLAKALPKIPAAFRDQIRGP